VKGKLSVIGLVVFFLLFGIAYFAWISYLSPRAKAIDRVKLSLNDPDSAIFKNVTYYSKSHATCGSVNAKNRMGGYDGFNAFLVEKDGTVRYFPDGDTASAITEVRLEALKKQNAFFTLMRACRDVER
jgi:hypothetical protein